MNEELTSTCEKCGGKIELRANLWWHEGSVLSSNNEVCLRNQVERLRKTLATLYNGIAHNEGYSTKQWGWALRVIEGVITPEQMEEAADEGRK